MKKTVPLMLLGVSALALSPGCSLKKPLAPTWDVEVAVPLAHKVTSMDEIVRRTSALHVDTTATDTSIVSLDIHERIPATQIGDNLQLLAPSGAASMGLGAVTFPPIEEDVALIQAWPDSRQLQDSSLVVPPLPGTLGTANDLPQSSMPFQSIQVQSGNLVLEVTNGYPVIVDNLQITFRDATYGVIGSFAFPSLGLGQVGSDTLSLAGKTLTNALRDSISFASPGSGGQLVRVDTLSNLTLLLRFQDLILSSGTAQIPTRDMQLADSVQLLNMRLSEATLHRGWLDIQLQNDLPLDLTQLSMRLPQMRDDSGDTLRLLLPVGAHASQTFSRSLAGCSFHGNASRYLEYDLVAASPATPGFVSFLGSESLHVQTGFSDLMLESVSGILDSVRVGLPVAEQTVQMPEGLGGIRFTDPALMLTFDYGREIQIPVRFQLTFVGVDPQGISHDLFVEETTYLPGDPAIVVDTSNSTIADFMYFLPNRIVLDTARSFLYLGDGIHSGSLTRVDVVSGDANFSAPFDAILEGSRVNPDPESTTIDPDVNLPPISGSVQYWIKNHLPFAVDTILICISEDSASLFSNPRVQVGPVAIPRPALSPSGRVVAERETTGTVVLSESDLAIFENPDKSRSKKLYSGLILKVPGSNGQRVRVYAQDYVEVRATANLRVRMDKDQFKSD